MSFDARIRDRVSALTKKVGSPIEVVRRTLTSDADPVLSTTRKYSVVARVVAYSERDIDGSLVKVGDLMVRIPAKDLDITPSVKDQVIFAGQTREIVNVRPSYISTTVAFWDLQVR